MKLWIVGKSEWDNWTFLGAFDTEDKAIECSERHRTRIEGYAKDTWVERIELNKDVSI